MLSRLLKEHQAKQNERKELQGSLSPRKQEGVGDRPVAGFLGSATLAKAVKRDFPKAQPGNPGIANPLPKVVEKGVAQAYMNQRKLDHEVKTLQVQAAQFAKQTGQWIGMVENFNQALKEIGDVENWARSIELDMRTIATALEYVYKGQLQSAPS
ncbi:Biogenesis of lysosome-related organelles complex 1 subunit 1 [Cricetulus griseus]|uniref:Biogenesis of lysosome-related organelles complex 1 subunit 1 n=1 Tax=Cricetulus griseus TaxID=10029 RepID=G3HRL9_CRIGR|nr:Biogenesis of lysosome-related organelles complex 1 subunit 1 [Cricetulus griseus]ERE91700.1 biogeneis of lysosome-related organelles complex 1 subunit 1-like protein [Cricetulus griseus]